MGGRGEGHCEKCYDDKDEMSDVQAERIRGHGSRVQIIIHRVLPARGTLMKNEEDGHAMPGDRDAARCTHGVRVRDHPLIRESSRRSAEPQRPGKSCVWSSQEARRQRRERPTRIPRDRTAESSSKWYTSVLVGFLHEEKESIQQGSTWAQREVSTVCICRLC